MNKDMDFNLPEKVIHHIVYNADTDFSKITNVLLVDNRVRNYDKFVENCNESTFSITFSQRTDKQEIVDLLASKLPSISRIAIVADDSAFSGNKKLLNFKPYFLNSDLIETPSSYSENVQFLIDLIKVHGVKNIDYLACNSLLYDNWKGYYSVLAKETGVVVGASSDQTGNIKYGGNWVMESTGVDVEAVYFTSGISGYQGTLVAYISTSGTLSQSGSTFTFKPTVGSNRPVTFPLTLASNVTLTFISDLELTNIADYFIIINNSNITIDGASRIVTIKNVVDYPGLVSSNSNSTVVKNIGVVPNTGTTTTTLFSSSGWVGQSQFLGTIDNCYSTGAISDGSGGIAGGYTGTGGICTISNCYSTGAISIGSGGIAGQFTGTESGNCTITNCYSTGSISETSGGIAGRSTGRNNGKCTITNSYSTGAISDNSGGIAGSSAGGNGGVCTITNSYSTGAISDNSGGITGGFAGRTNGKCTISNCYSTGAISDFSGGIASYGAGYESGKCAINNCYSTGGANSDECGGIFGYEAEDTCTISNSYVTGSFSSTNYFQPNNSSAEIDDNTEYTPTWLDETASLLDNTYTTSTTPWKPIYLNNPWKLLSFLSTVVTNYNNGTLKYTSVLPISAYPNALTAKLLNNGTTYSIATLTLTQNIVTFTETNGIDNGLPTYLVLYNGNTIVDYANTFTITQVTTTSTSTTIAPTSYTLVQFAIRAVYEVVIPNQTAEEVYEEELNRRINFYTGAPLDTITILSVTSGSIVNVVRLPTQYVDALRDAIQSRNFYITIGDVRYYAIDTSFIIIDNICFRKGTMILTPGGYRAVQSLKTGELVRTAQGRNVAVTKVHNFIGKREKCPLYVLRKDSLGRNVPVIDLYMSEGHAYSHKGLWTHMKCSSKAIEIDMDNIEYYHIAVENYLQHTLVANGVEVESLFDIEGLKMTWNCKKDDCKPIITMK
jgi:hypothetical protein